MSTSSSLDKTIATDSETPPTVFECDSTPEKTVFVEENNSDGWIATSLTIPITQ